jgi:MFS family permease
LWAAQVLSLLGDQLARVAVAILVYTRTGSPGLTAGAYAVSFLPWLVGGPILASLADRYPRREVMVWADTCRVGLLSLMALPAVPIGAMLVLLFAAELFEPAFSAARAALLPEVLDDDRYVAASAVTTITREATQLTGFALGGALVVLLNVREALLLDAATFLVSALAVRFGVRSRPTGAPAKVARHRHGLTAGARLIAHAPGLRALTALAWLCAFYVIPEALAAPIASSMQGGPFMVGLLMAANPAGTVLGSLAVARLPPPRRLRLMTPLAALSMTPMVFVLLRPTIPALLGLLLLSGVGSAYNLPANAAFVAAVPAALRGRAFGVVQTGMYVGQGVVILLAGLLAQFVDARTVVALGGGLGLLLVIKLRGWLREATRPGSGLPARPRAAVGTQPV